MALHDFWRSVRTGASFLAPRATVDSPKLDAGRIERMLRSAVIWLTPKSVEGFNEADFSFLSDQERKKLADLVARFREVASQVPPAAPATKKQMEQALPLFLDLIGLLEFDRFGDAEAYRIGKEIEKAITSHRPKELAELRFDTGPDNTGDPAIWIWAILTDEAAEEPVFAGHAKTIRKLLESASRTVAAERWPYVRFRTLSEQADVYAEMAEAQVS